MDHQAFAQLLGNYGEFVGAIAVVATLAYLAMQIRQNSAQLKINSYQTSVDRFQNQIANVTEDPAKFEMFRIGLTNYDELAIQVRQTRLGCFEPRNLGFISRRRR